MESLFLLLPITGVAGFIAGMLYARWRANVESIKGKVPEDFHSQFLKKHYE